MAKLANPRVIGFAVLGLVILGVAVSFSDIGDLAQVLSLVGWRGGLGLIAWRVLPMGLCILALWAILPNRTLGMLGPALGARLSRDGVAALLPVLPAGGEVVCARMLHLGGLSGALALAVTVADLTLEIGAQALFSALGFIMLGLALPGDIGGNWGGIAIALPLLMILGLALLQHPKVATGLVRFAVRLAGQAMPAEHVTTAIATVYGNKTKALQCALLHFAGWLIGVGEAWLALGWMGHPLPLTNVIALESVVFALKGIAFMIPWSIGVQEGGYMALGLALGVPADIALSLSLLKRLPDLGLGLPGLALWHLSEKANRQPVPIEA